MTEPDPDEKAEMLVDLLNGLAFGDRDPDWQPAWDLLVEEVAATPKLAVIVIPTELANFDF